jgi:hypothetical protein
MPPSWLMRGATHHHWNPGTWPAHLPSSRTPQITRSNLAASLDSTHPLPSFCLSFAQHFFSVKELTTYQLEREREREGGIIQGPQSLLNHGRFYDRWSRRPLRTLPTSHAVMAQACKGASARWSLCPRRQTMNFLPWPGWLPTLASGEPRRFVIAPDRSHRPEYVRNNANE